MSVVEDAIYAEFNSSTQYNELCDLYTRTTHRVRKALFPEILIEDDTNVDVDVNNTSVVGNFAQPSLLLKNAILDLISIKDQLLDSSTKIPQLIRSLHDPNPNVVAQAARDVYLLSREDKFIAQLAENEHLIGALIHATKSSSEEARRDAIAGLSHISQQGQAACYRIFRTDGIDELVRMLRSPVVAIVHYAVTTLHNLLIYVEMAKERTIVCGGLEALTPHLAATNHKLQALVADSLYFLLLDRPQCKLSFLSLQGPRYLVAILNSNIAYVKLLHAVVRCVRSIGTCPENKASLVSIGGLEALHLTLSKMNDDKRKLAVLNAMRNLSDAATNLDTLTGLIADLVSLVDIHPDEEVVSCACGILSNLTCNNIPNKQTVCTNNGIQILARALTRFPNIEDVTEPALCTLRHCTVRHPLAHQAQNEIRFAHQVILSLLATRRPPIVKAALGLVRNCALSQVNLDSIISKTTPEGDTVVSIAIEILESAGVELRQDFNGLTEGVSLLEMVEGAISALHQLAKDPYSAKLIYCRPTLMNILVDLMSYDQVSQNEDELMMRELMGLIYQLTKTPEGAKEVFAYESQPHISAALNSTHKSIAAYASIILKNMGVESVGSRFGVNHHGHYAAGNGYHAASALGAMSYVGTDTMGSGGSGQRRHGEMGWLNDGMEPELYNELYNYPPSLGDIKHDHIEGNAQNGSWFDTDL